MAGRRGRDPHDAGGTMQIDALVDELEDLGPGDELGAAPPPLPPRRTPTLVWVGGGVVVLLAVALGIGAGIYMIRAEPEAVASPAAPSVPPVRAPTQARVPPVAAPELAPEAAPDEPGVVQLDEVVFGGEPVPP